MNLSMVSSTFQTLVKFYLQAQRMVGLYTDSSIADITRLTKVQPFVIISRDLMGADYMPDLAQGLLNYTIADYSQAINILTKVQDIEVIKILDKLNPSRDATSIQLMVETMESRPNYAQFSLPTEGNMLTVTMESRPDASDATSLAVGKQVEVTIEVKVGKDGDTQMRCVKLPIEFRLLPRYVSSPQITRILGAGVDDTGFFARLDRMRDGGISVFTDFFMASDLINEQRRTMIKDDSRVLQDILKRVSTNKKVGMMTNNPSLVTLSNIFIMSESEAAALEGQFGGKMSVKATRDRIFQNVFASTLVVVNRQWNTVTYWQRGMDSSAEVTFKELKASSNNGKAVDLFDQMKSFNMGIPPSF